MKFDTKRSKFHWFVKATRFTRASWSNQEADKPLIASSFARVSWSSKCFRPSAFIMRRKSRKKFNFFTNIQPTLLLFDKRTLIAPGRISATELIISRRVASVGYRFVRAIGAERRRGRERGRERKSLFTCKLVFFFAIIIMYARAVIACSSSSSGGKGERAIFWAARDPITRYRSRNVGSVGRINYLLRLIRAQHRRIYAPPPPPR